jgi:hypothetical protein
MTSSYTSVFEWESSRNPMLEAVSSSETLVSIYQNLRKKSHLHTRRRENLKSHQDVFRVSRLSFLVTSSNIALACTTMCHGKIYTLPT